MSFLLLLFLLLLLLLFLADCNQPSILGGATGGFSTVSAKLGKKGLAEGLRPDPGGVTDGGEEGLVTGDTFGGKFFSSGEVGLFTEEEEDEE